MNTKTFDMGFKLADATISAACAIARGTKHSAVASGTATTSFFAGMKQAVRVRKGKCLMLSGPVAKNEE